LKKKHSIKKTLLVGLIGVTAAVSVMYGAVNSILLYRVAISNMETRLQENATAYNHSVQNAIATYKTKVEAIAADEAITDAERTDQERDSRRSELAKKYGFNSVTVANSHGECSDGTNVLQQEYYKQSIANTTYFSSPLVDDATKKTVLVVSARITNGNYNGIVIATLSSDTFSKMVCDVAVGKSGSAFITDRDGTIIADKNQKNVTGAVNYITLAKKDASYAKSASVVQKMIAGKKGTETTSFSGSSVCVSYQPIQNTDGWSIGVMAKTSEMLSKFYESVALTVALMVVFILLSIYLAIRIAKPIADPISRLVARIEKLADGDLHSEVPQIQSKNEVGVLSQSFTKTVDALNAYIGEISDVLSSLENGDCTVTTKLDYQGDFVAIRDSLEAIVANLNGVFSKVRSSADQVAAGAEQISNASQALSQGATEQASSIEELSASITEINEKTGANASRASDANELAKETWERMEEGRRQMQQMVAAMADISDSSAKIQQIIKTIEDIAFQTNILSLNAAVEAARAGEAGKGFAVVADEVRNLAGKSAAAAKDTSELIESSLAAVQNGRKIADATEKSFQTILEASQKTDELISGIAESSNEQASSISQITQGVEQISSVVQTNSATSEESAAASEELSSQAKALKDALASLKLKDSED
jgi:methyl-accepting chemotaxis protein